MEGGRILMEIIRGKLKKAKRVAIYGPEGVGKSTLAAQFPGVLFIDTEGSTAELDVARTREPLSWTALTALADEAARERACQTLAIDTADWAERLCARHVCAQRGVGGIEDFNYGKGYTHLYEEFGKFLNRLRDIADSGINVVLTAHAAMRKIEQPDEFGSYDHWEMKLSKQVAPIVKEWADIVLFLNFKVDVAKRGRGDRDSGGKAQGGRRVMYAEHHPCWDAKNRCGLPPEMPLAYRHIAHLFEDAPPAHAGAGAGAYAGADAGADAGAGVDAGAPAPAPWPPAMPAPGPGQGAAAEAPPAGAAAGADADGFRPISVGDAINISAAFPDEPLLRQAELPGAAGPPGGGLAPEPRPPEPQGAGPPHIAQLRQLMLPGGATDAEVQAAVAARGYFPADTPVESYPPDFVEGVLVAAWDKVFGIIQAHREGLEVF
jgi:hypothetical protein